MHWQSSLEQSQQGKQAISKITENNHKMKTLTATTSTFALFVLPTVAAFSTTTTTLQERATLMDLLPKSGFIGNDSKEAKNVCEACTALEKTAAEETVTFPQEGTWRLRFTSASPYGLLPEQLALPEAIRKTFIDDSLLLPMGVEQTIDNERIVNRIDLAPWPKNSNNNGLQQILFGAITGLEALQDSTIHLELDHSFSVENSNKVDLSLETVRRNLETTSELELPAFIPKETSYNLPFAPSGSFKTTYADSTLRIDRGSRFPLQDEVFVFERVGAAALVDAEIMEGEECELAYEEDGTPVILCENVEDDSIPSD